MMHALVPRVRPGLAGRLALAVVFLTAGGALADNYGAIAYSQSTGKYGYSYGFDSREEAEQTALKYCEEKDAEVVVWARDAWCALAVDLDGDAYGWAWDQDPAAAKDRALSECQKRTDNCFVTLLVSADGTVEKYDAPMSFLRDLPKPRELPKLPKAFFPSEGP